MVHKQGGLYMKKLLIILGIALSFLLATNSNNTITFQGYLTNIDGSGVFGDRYMGFILYGVQTGGTPIVNAFPYSEIAYRKVTVYNGNYATKINLSDAALTILNSSPEVWVAVYVSNSEGAGDPTGVAQYLMSPRIQLTATPYATNVRGVNYNATNHTVKLGSDAAYLATAAQSNANEGLLVQGNVGIGTTDPTAKLDVRGNVSANGTVFFGNKLTVASGGSTITGNVVVNGTINSATITGGTLSSGSYSGATITGGTMSGTLVNGAEIAGGRITASAVVGAVWN
jgi:hypothetical protein